MTTPVNPILDFIRDLVRSEVIPALREEVRATVSALAAPGRHAAAAEVDSASVPDGAWSKEQAAEYLGIAPSTVLKLEREGRLPALPRTTTRITFDPETVRAFRANGSVNVVQLGRSRRK